jgi:dTDP-4-amino-4,6-dideoxygalactose transaminase
VNVPLLDLAVQYRDLKPEIDEALARVFASQRFILGPEVGELEAQLAALCGARFGVSCASGTDALLLPLKALHLGPGDEVITTAFTFFATAGAIHNAGGRPVFVDIDAATFNIDPDAVAAAWTDRTRAVVPVHLFGQVANLERVLPLAERSGAMVLEDAAQAIGARRRVDGRWRMAGEMGTAGAFSFFPTKNLGGWGDGGMMVTQDETLAGRLRRLRVHGGAKEYHHEEIGTNSRLDTLQAAVLLAKLPHLARWNAARAAHAARYDEGFADLDAVRAPHTDPANEHIFHQYTLRVERRDALAAHLAARNIGHKVYYPVPLHRQECFAALGYQAGQLPEAERAAREVLSLPVYPELTADQCDAVIAAVREFYQ